MVECCCCEIDGNKGARRAFLLCMNKCCRRIVATEKQSKEEGIKEPF